MLYEFLQKFKSFDTFFFEGKSFDTLLSAFKIKII